VAIAKKDEHGEEWRLGIELSDDHEHEDEAVEGAAEAAHDLSGERLERPLHVVTAENLGWAAIAAYAAITRLLALGARPLDGVEAGHALYSFDVASPGSSLAAGFEPSFGGWVHLLTAGGFAVGGANDVTARLLFALSGLLLIAMAFELRHYIGRAGGLALGAMIALSPSITYYSRASATATPAIALALVTVAVFMALKSRPSRRRAAALGLFAGLMMAADPMGLATAIIFVAALIPIGLWDAVTGKNVFLSVRVWLDRYSSQLVAVIVTAAAVWAVSQMMIPGGLSANGITRSWPSIAGTGASFTAGLHRCAPVLALYEFMIGITAVFGALMIVTLNVRSRFAAWALIWAALSSGYFCWTATTGDGGSILGMLIPAAVVGAIGLNWLHHSEGWRLVRIPLAAIAALTLYVGTVANFVWCAPDASEAPWSRHANLFWGEKATTEQARIYARQAASGIAPVNATVNFDDKIGAPLHWYLRNLRPIANADGATVVVSKAGAPTNGPPLVANYHFDEAEGWIPNFSKGRAGEVIRFLLGGRIWGAVTSNDVAILVRKPAGSAPTVILTPGE
jgi:predicted membrane-bound mannosyltransferase